MKKILNFAVLTLFAALTSCQPMKKADLIITNAKIYTVDDGFSMAEAMAIKDGKILAIGTEEVIIGSYDSPLISDLSGLPVYPGFIDAHCHFYGYGLGLLKRADLVGTESFG